MFFTKKTAPLKIRNQKNPLKIWRNIKKNPQIHWRMSLAAGLGHEGRSAEAGRRVVG